MSDQRLGVLHASDDRRRNLDLLRPPPDGEGRHVTLLDRSALVTVCEVIDVLTRTSSCCIVAGRPSDRSMLSRWGLPTRFAVFSSVGDALQARMFAESGYGPGWRPAARTPIHPPPLLDHAAR